MARCAKEGTCLAKLVQMAVHICQQAERECPRTGPGRKPEIPDWLMAVLIMIVVLKKRKFKRAQYRFLNEHREELMLWLKVDRFPSQTTYFERYRRAYQLFQAAIRLQAEEEIALGHVEPQCVAIDKSPVRGRGPCWGRKSRCSGKLPAGADAEATWTYSTHHGWIQGYAYEVVVTADGNGPVWPLAASVEPASSQKSAPALEKLTALPSETKHVLADSGYDRDALGEAVEWDGQGHRTGRHFLCPEINRRGKRKTSTTRRNSYKRALHQARRQQRKQFFQSHTGRRLFALRGSRLEPFNEWFKALFDLKERAWHRGLANNRTQILAALFAYQLLLRYNRMQGRNNGQLLWILESL
jgi:hypothetical protein